MRALLKRFRDFFRDRSFYCDEGHPHVTAEYAKECNDSRRLSEALTKFEPWVITAFQPGDVVILRSRSAIEADELDRVRAILAEWHKQTGVKFFHLSSDFEVVAAKRAECFARLEL